jgi:hypothetical protein
LVLASSVDVISVCFGMPVWQETAAPDCRERLADAGKRHGTQHSGAARAVTALASAAKY